MLRCACCNGSAEPHKVVNCCICAKAYKIECVDISNAEARKIHQRTGLSWSCKNCAKIGNDLNSLKALVVSLQEDIRVIKERSVCPNSSLMETERIIQEVAERDKRKTNIVVFGAKESVCRTNAEQLNMDVDFVNGMLSDMKIEETINKVIRLGKFDNTNQHRCRPLKFSLSSETAVFVL